MGRVFRILRWATIGTVLLIGLLVLAVGLYTHTEHFRRLVREQLVSVVNGAMRGSISLGKIEGSIWGSVTLHDVRLRYQDAEIARIPRLRLVYEVLPLLRGRFQIARAEAVQPSFTIVRDAKGRWNIAEAFSSPGEAVSEFSLLLKVLAVRDGSVDIRLGDKAPEEYRLRNLTIQSRLAILPGGIEFEAGEAGLSLVSSAWPELRLKGGIGYWDAGSAPKLSVNGLLMETAASRLRLSAELVGFDKSRLRAMLSIDKLAAVDLARVVPDWPLKSALAGRIALEGPLESLVVDSELSAASAKLESDLVVNLSAAAPRYKGSLRITGFDLREFVDEKQAAGLVDGRVEIDGAGFAFGEIAGTGAFTVRSAQAKGWELGKLTLSTELREREMTLKGELRGALGSATWQGGVTFARVPNYRFDLAVNSLDIKKISGAGKELGGVVSFAGKIKGAGATLAQLNAEADLRILPSTIGPVQLAKGDLVASIAAGRLRVARASLSSAESTLALKGDLGLDFTQRGKLDYEFRTADLSLWLALVERKGGGALTFAGSAQGNIEELTTRGAIKLTRIRVDAAAIESGDIDFTLTRRGGEVIPDGRVRMRIAGVDAGVRLQKLDAKANLASSPTPTAEIELQTEDAFGRLHSTKARVHYKAEELVANVSQLKLSLPDGAWSLAGPAIISKRGDSVRVENLRLRNRERQAALEGVLALSGQQALDLTVDKFPLEAVAAFMPKEPKLTGLVALQARVAGTAAAPDITAQIRLTDSTIGSHRYAGMSGNITYRARQASLDFNLRQDATHSLTATVKLPLELSWHEEWRMRVLGDVDLRLKSSGLSLAFLNTYTAKTVSNLDGELTVDLAARGALWEPVLSGSFEVINGRLKAPLLNVDVEKIALEGVFDARSLRVKSFSAHAHEGRLTGAGSVALKNYQIENFHLALAARRWPAIRTRRYQAEVGGDIAVEGPLAGPKLSGEIVITDSNIRPDLTFLERSSTSVKRDETIVVVSRSEAVKGAANEKNQSNGLGDNELFKKLTVDLKVAIPRNVWVRHPDAVAELAGDIHATKKFGEHLQLVGKSEIVRGWVAFQGRRFNFTRGEIRFVGGDRIDPALDIVAQHRLPQYIVDAVVGGTVSNPTLTLRSDPSLDQADILALLLFGKPTKDLNRGEESALRQNAIDLSAGFAAAQIGSAVAEAIGLDGFGLGEIEFTGGRVGIGRYLGDRTYVTVGQDLAGERGQEAKIEYQLAPDWKVGTSTTSDGASEVDLIWQKRY